MTNAVQHIRHDGGTSAKPRSPRYNKLLMVMALAVCAVVGSAQELPKRTLGRRLQCLAASAERKQQLHNTTANCVEWTYEVVDGCVFLGSAKSRLLPWEKAKSAVPKSTTGDLVIPETIAGMPARGIGIGAFSCCSNLTSVTILSGVTSIGERAFEDCVGLVSLTIPSSVTSIGASAFSCCSGLNSILVDPENSAYCSIYGLLCSKDGRTLIRGVNGDVTIPLGVTNVRDGAFGGCSKLKSVMIPSSVVSIKGWAFGACSGLMSINVDAANPRYSSINSMLCSKDGRRLIRGVNGVVAIPSGVTSVENGAFAGCGGLTSVTIPTSVKEIGGWAFSDCSGLTNVTIPSDLKNVAYSAFSGCTSLKAVNVVKDGKIEVLSFDDFCKNLQSVNENGIEWAYAVDDGGVVLGSEEWRRKRAKLAVPQSTSGALIIPETLAGMPVRGIGIGAFSGCSNLTSVAIPSSVRIIRDQAFEDCVGLASMMIPSSVYRIFDSAFSGCRGLKSFVVDSENRTYSSTNGLLCSKDGRTLIQYVCGDGTIPLTVKNIGDGAFKNCSRLKSIKIPSSVDNVGHDAFKGCSELTSLVIADGVNSIGYDAFSGCSNLTAVTIPSSVKKVGFMAFSNCVGLREVTLSEGVTNIECQAFWRCRNLTSITLPMSLKTIESSAFGDCSELRSVKIPSSVTSIRGSPFSGCSKLETITIPPCVKEMSDVISTWDGGTNVKEVVMYEGVTSIGKSMFERMTSLKSVTIPSSVTNIGDYAFRYCSGLTNITIPSGLKKIGRLAFADCSGLTSVTMPSGLKNIDATAFSGCKNLKTVDVVTGGNAESLSFDEFCKRLNTVKANGVEWTYEVAGDGIVLGSGDRFVALIEKAKKAVHRNTSGALIIPGTIAGLPVRGIGFGAFSCCSNLTSVTIPSSVTSIGKWAFKDCERLTSLTIPSSVTSIGDSAFSGCSGLKSFEVEPENSTYCSVDGLLCSKDGRTLIRYVIGDGVIPLSVTSIGGQAFADCSGLTSVTIPSSVTNIMRGAFAGCSDLTSFVVDPKNPAYCSINGLLCSKDGCNLIQGVNGDVQIPSSVTNIGDCAFRDYERLTSVMIPSSVKIIGDCAFDGCRGLTSVKIMPGVMGIGAAAFSGCTNLTSVTLPSSLRYIDEWAFRGCSSLTNMAVLSSTTSIAQWAFGETPFYDNKPDGLVIFGNGVLYTYKGECPSSIKIPLNVSGINVFAFYGLNALESIDVDCGNPTYSAVDGVLYNKSKTCLIRCPVGKKGGVTIPMGVTCIGDDAFDACGGLASVVIPPSVTNVGRSAFSRCKELASLTIPACVTNVHSSAFSGCSKLETVNVVKDGKIEPIPFDEFCEKWNLDKPRLNWRRRIRRSAGSMSRTVAATTGGNSVANGLARQDGALAGGDQEKKREAERAEQRRQLLAIQEELARVRGGKSASVQNAEATDGGMSGGSLRARRLQRQQGAQSAAERKSVEKPVVVTESCTTNKAACSCTNTQGAKDDTKVVKGTNEVDGIAWFYSIVNGEATIVSPTGEFGACAVSPKPTGKVAIPSSFDGAPVTAIGKHAFRYCREMNAVKIPASVRRIGKDAFWGTALKSVAIPSSVETIGDAAFCCCLKMTSVVLPENVSHIGGMAFYQCRELESVTMRGERPDVKGNVFDKCENLAVIHVPAKAKSWAGMKEWQGIPLVFDAMAK